MKRMRKKWECRIFLVENNCWLVPLWTKRKKKWKGKVLRNFVTMTNRIRPILEVTIRSAFKSNVKKIWKNWTKKSMH